MRRYLFGPVPFPFAEQNLANARRRGACVTFHTNEYAEADLTIAWQITWDDLVGRLPVDWRPEAIILYLPYTVIPACLWSAPLPVVGLAGDVISLWPLYQKILPLCDAVLCTHADRDAVAERTGKRVIAGPLGALHPELPPSPLEVEAKDIDVLLLTGEPGARPGPWRVWLNRFAELADRWRIRVCALDDWHSYAELCPRARTVFALDQALDQTHWLRRALESRAIVFLSREATLPPELPGGEHWVAYGESNWRYLLEYYLTHEKRRAELAEAAGQRLAEFPPPSWEQMEEQLFEQWQPHIDISRRRFRMRPDQIELIQVHQTLLSRDEDAAESLRDSLQSRITGGEDDPAVLHALGLLTALPDQGEEPCPDSAQRGLSYLRQAASTADAPLIFRFNALLAHALTKCDAEIIAEAEGLLACMDMSHDRLAPALWDGLLLANGEGIFCDEWARICWHEAFVPSQCDLAKRNLIRWRLHQITGVASNDVNHYFEAVAVRPDLPSGRTLLGNALSTAGRLGSAVLHWQQSLQADPQQPETVGRLYALLQHKLDDIATVKLRQHYDHLQQIAPAWFPEDEWRSLLPLSDGESASDASRVDADGAREQLPASEHRDETKPVPAIGYTTFASTKSGKATVSLCIIVKNEEHNLAACLQPVASLMDEIVVVDTGSTDRTKEIAAGFGARVFDFPWVDSFAAARNETLKHATCDWVFWLDADDRVDTDNQRKLKHLFKALPDELAAFLMLCICPTIGDDNRSTETVAHARLFRRHPKLCWRYRVHEQILLSVQELGGKTYASDIAIQHEGYHRGQVMEGKLERNIALLQKNALEAPEDAYVHFYLGWTHMQLGKLDEAVTSLEMSRRFLDSRLSIAAKLFSLLINVYRRQGHQDRAWGVCREGRERFPKDSELLFVEGGFHLDVGNFLEAENCFLRLVAGKSSMPLSGADAGIHTYKAHHNLAVAYQRQKQWRKAEHHWRQCLQVNPHFRAAWLNLGECFLLQKNSQDAEKTAADFEATCPGALESVVLRARLLAFDKKFADAHALVADLTERFPEEVLPRMVAAQMHRQEGADSETQAQAWREVLALDPKHAEAKKQLTRCLRK